MVELSHYLDDGASWQAKSVLAYLQHNEEILLDDYYGMKIHNCLKIRVGRFENCREQGYYLVVTLPGRSLTSFGYAFAEYRSSDSIVVYTSKSCANVYSDTPKAHDFFEGADDDYMYFSCGKIVECGEWIMSDIKTKINKFIEENPEYNEKA